MSYDEWENHIVLRASCRESVRLQIEYLVIETADAYRVVKAREAGIIKGAKKEASGGLSVPDQQFDSKKAIKVSKSNACPYCESKSIFFCSCGHAMCLNDLKDDITCPNCGLFTAGETSVTSKSDELNGRAGIIPESQKQAGKLPALPGKKTQSLSSPKPKLLG